MGSDGCIGIMLVYSKSGMPGAWAVAGGAFGVEFGDDDIAVFKKTCEKVGLCSDGRSG